jgi:glycine dehydrogenase subunit 1
MQYIPNVPIMDEMLSEMGLSSIDQLFEDIPEEVRINGLNLPDSKSQIEVDRELRNMYSKNRTLSEGPSFLGGGVYHHYIPPAVGEVISRSEFYSCYTPYQPELSQGMIQALWEYQSFIAEITQMDAANSSMYDVHTALGEAALMSIRLTRNKKKFVVPKNIHWEKRQVLDAYVRWRDVEVVDVDYDPATGKVDLAALESTVDEETAGVYIENPNFFGVFEDDVEKVREIAGDAMMVVGVNPMSLGIVRSPGEYGADMVIGEGQAFGNRPNLGGPLVGIFACKKEHIRRMPGRIMGLTKDQDERRAFCMTLQTREQHIRRDKATSNICTNEALAAVASSIHLALLGKEGLRKMGIMNITKAKYLRNALAGIDGLELAFPDSYHFNEFIVRSAPDPNEINNALLAKGIQGGLVIKDHFPSLGNATLYTTTEIHTEEDHKELLNALKEVIQ